MNGPSSSYGATSRSDSHSKTPRAPLPPTNGTQLPHEPASSLTPPVFFHDLAAVVHSLQRFHSGTNITEAGLAGNVIVTPALATELTKVAQRLEIAIMVPPPTVPPIAGFAAIKYGRKPLAAYYQSLFAQRHENDSSASASSSRSDSVAGSPQRWILKPPPGHRLFSPELREELALMADRHHYGIRFRSSGDEAEVRRKPPPLSMLTAGLSTMPSAGTRAGALLAATGFSSSPPAASPALRRPQRQSPPSSPPAPDESARPTQPRRVLSSPPAPAIAAGIPTESAESISAPSPTAVTTQDVVSKKSWKLVRTNASVAALEQIVADFISDPAITRMSLVADAPSNLQDWYSFLRTAATRRTPSWAHPPTWLLAPSDGDDAAVPSPPLQLAASFVADMSPGGVRSCSGHVELCKWNPIAIADSLDTPESPTAEATAAYRRCLGTYAAWLGARAKLPAGWSIKLHDHEVAGPVLAVCNHVRREAFVLASGSSARRRPGLCAGGRHFAAKRGRENTDGGCSDVPYAPVTGSEDAATASVRRHGFRRQLYDAALEALGRRSDSGIRCGADPGTPRRLNAGASLDLEYGLRMNHISRTAEAVSVEMSHPCGGGSAPPDDTSSTILRVAHCFDPTPKVVATAGDVIVSAFATPSPNPVAWLRLLVPVLKAIGDVCLSDDHRPASSVATMLCGDAGRLRSSWPAHRSTRDSGAAACPGGLLEWLYACGIVAPVAPLTTDGGGQKGADGVDGSIDWGHCPFRVFSMWSDGMCVKLADRSQYGVLRACLVAAGRGAIALRISGVVVTHEHCSLLVDGISIGSVSSDGVADVEEPAFYSVPLACHGRGMVEDRRTAREALALSLVEQIRSKRMGISAAAEQSPLDSTAPQHSRADDDSDHASCCCFMLNTVLVLPATIRLMRRVS